MYTSHASHTSRRLAQLLVTALGLLLLGGIAGRASAQATDLFISEFVDGPTVTNRAIELFNLTGVPIDLAAGGYKIRVYPNGSTTPAWATSSPHAMRRHRTPPPRSSARSGGK